MPQKTVAKAPRFKEKPAAASGQGEARSIRARFLVPRRQAGRASGFYMSQAKAQRTTCQGSTALRAWPVGASLVQDLPWLQSHPRSKAASRVLNIGLGWSEDQETGSAQNTRCAGSECSVWWRDTSRGRCSSRATSHCCVFRGVNRKRPRENDPLRIVVSIMRKN